MFDQFHKKSAKDTMIPPSERFTASPESHANWTVREVIEELLANKVSLFHGQFQVDGVSVGLMMLAGADAARLMKLAGNAIAAGLDSEVKNKAAPTGPTPKDM